MESFMISFNTIFPLFCYMSLGYLLRRLSMLDAHTIAGMNKLTFHIFFPILLFKNIYRTNISEVLHPKLLLAVFAAVTLIFVASFLIIPLLEPDRSKAATLVQAIYRGNFVLMGVPITQYILGPERLGLTGVMMAIFIPYFNILSVICFEICGNVRPRISVMCKRLLKNPLIISTVLAVLVLLTGLPVPGAVSIGITGISNMVTPLALILLGATFQFGSIRGYLKQLVIGVGVKLLLVPGIVIPVFICMGVRGADLVPVVVLFAAPTATISYPMAVQMGGDGELAGQLVAFSSSLSVITMFLWIFGLRTLGYI